MATKAQIRDRAAQDLGRLRVGQSLQSQDVARIESGYDEIYAQLKKDGLAVWASTGSVPDELTPHVAALVAENCLNTYGVSDVRYQRIVNAATIARREIKKFTTPDYVSQSEPSDY